MHNMRRYESWTATPQRRFLCRSALSIVLGGPRRDETDTQTEPSELPIRRYV